MSTWDKKKVKEFLLTNVLLRIAIALLLLQPLNTYLTEVYHHPQITIDVTETVGIQDNIWKNHIYWRSDYGMHKVNISNVGTALTKDLVVHLSFPGRIFSVVTEDLIRADIEADLVVFRNSEYWYDPVTIGKMSWPRIGEENDPILGSSNLGVKISFLGEKDSWSCLVYIDKSKATEDALTISGIYSYREKTKSFGSESLSLSETPWIPPVFDSYPSNPFIEPRGMNASVDIDESTPGYQLTYNTSPNELVKIDFSIDLRKHYTPNSLVLVNVIGDWAINEPLGYLYNGLAGDAFLQSQLTFTAPSDPGTYHVRVFIIFSYEFAADFYASNLDASSGFECILVVS